MMTAQYRNGWKDFAVTWIATVTMKNEKKIAVPIAYPRCIVIVTASAAVSPMVVAAILMIQNAKVTSGTLFKLISRTLPMLIVSPRVLRRRAEPADTFYSVHHMTHGSSE